MQHSKRKTILTAALLTVFLALCALACVGVYAHSVESVWIEIRNHQEMRGFRVTDYERGVLEQCDGGRPATLRFACNGIGYAFPLPAGSTSFANGDFPESEKSLQFMATSSAFGAWSADMDECAPDGFDFERLGNGYSFTGWDGRTLVHIGRTRFGRNYTVFYFLVIERTPAQSGGYTFRDVILK